MKKLRGSLKLIRVRIEEELKKRKKNEYENLQLHKEYEDFDKAEKDLEDIKIDELKHHLFAGNKHYYKCEKDCSVRMYLELDQ